VSAPLVRSFVTASGGAARPSCPSARSRSRRGLTQAPENASGGIVVLGESGVPFVGEVPVPVPRDVVVHHDLCDGPRVRLDAERAALVDDSLDSVVAGLDVHLPPEPTAKRNLDVRCRLDAVVNSLLEDRERSSLDPVGPFRGLGGPGS
jgi:hypothetical protein